MPGYSAHQLASIQSSLSDTQAAMEEVKRRMERIRKIAEEHESMGCECSAALMILEVLDRG